MRLTKARVQKYRSVRDTGWFDVEDNKSILVGPNEAGKTAVLRALLQLNPPSGTPGFDQLRDYPRSELNDIDSGEVDPAGIMVALGEFSLEDDDVEVVREIDPAFATCRLVVGRRLTNKRWARVDGGPPVTTYGGIKKDLDRLVLHVDKQAATPASPGDALKKITAEWSDRTAIRDKSAEALVAWLDVSAHRA